MALHAQAMIALDELPVDVQREARRRCRYCATGTPHHTNSAYSIGGGDRRAVWDIHAVEDSSGVGLRECLAGDYLLAVARA